MKRITSIFLAAFLVLSLVVPVIADTDPLVYMDDETVAVGATKTVSIKIANNPGVSALTVKLVYDKSVFEIDPTSVECCFTGAPDELGVIEFGEITGASKFAWASSANNSSNGDFVTFDLTVKDDAAEGNYTFSLIVMEAGDVDMETYEVATDGAEVTVTAQAAVIYGDANGDGEVDLTDAVAICDYDAGLLTLEDFGPQA